MFLLHLYLLILSILFAKEVQSLNKSYPHAVLTADHGIITESYLLDEIKEINKASPFNMKSTDYGRFRWQCFPVKNVKPKYRYWKDADPMGYASVIVTMCDFDVTVLDGKIRHLYHGRRAKEVTYCNEFKKHFSRITKNEQYICLNGEPGSLEIKKEKGKDITTKYWVWNRIKTKKGCHSFFGDCEK